MSKKKFPPPRRAPGHSRRGDRYKLAAKKAGGAGAGGAASSSGGAGAVRNKNAATNTSIKAAAAAAVPARMRYLDSVAAALRPFVTDKALAEITTAARALKKKKVAAPEDYVADGSLRVQPKSIVGGTLSSPTFSSAVRSGTAAR